MTLTIVTQRNFGSASISFWRTRKMMEFPVVERDQIPLCWKYKADIFRETFFTRKHLETLSFNEEFKLHVENTLQQPLHSERPELESDRCFNCDLSSEELDYNLRFLKTSGKSLDNDNIHPKMIKYAGPRYKEVLLHIANRTLNENHWPWNQSKVIFLRKQGKTDYTTPSAYRPITISSCIGKSLERLLDARLRSFFKKFNLLDEEQEGFQSHTSTVRSLYRLKMECQEVRMSRKSGALISIDFEKAFNLYGSMDCSKNSINRELEVNSLNWLKVFWKADNSA